MLKKVTGTTIAAHGLVLSSFLIPSLPYEVNVTIPILQINNGKLVK